MSVIPDEENALSNYKILFFVNSVGNESFMLYVLLKSRLKQ